MASTVRPIVSAHPGRVIQLPSKMQSNVVYELLSKPDRDGCSEPMQLGAGKFAKVYKAYQRSAGRNIRPVAIKFLHDHVTHGDEQLFLQEIDLLKDLSAGPSVNIVSFIDIVRLGPMAMCGCGNIYSPLCPQGCGLPLERAPPAGKEHPILGCGKCGYELSAQHVLQRGGELLRPPAKPCCPSGLKAQKGHIINFVDREVMVMELLEHDLRRLFTERRAVMERIAEHHGTTLPDPRAAERRGVLGWLRRPEPSEWGPLQRVMLLEKVRLMVQLAETVTWLHAEKRIVHKDLAPDNVMVRSMGEESQGGDWRGDRASFQDKLSDLVCNPGFHLKVIDFGLSDKEELSKSWYEEEVGQGNWKQPYLSPEARAGARKLDISDPIEFEPDPQEGARFRVPRDVYRSKLSVMEGDILADKGDPRHDHDLEIVAVMEDPPGSDVHYARVRGQPPEGVMNRQFQLVRRLGEPHDIYALGALFYFILTGKNEEVEFLMTLVDSLLDAPCELTPEALMRRDTYPKRRAALPEPLYQDELMILILRAMVRGQPQSFVARRIDRGPGPAQRLLQEVKRVYYELQRLFW